VRKLFGAQMELLAAELGLARSAISWMLLAGLAATIAGVGCGLTVLGLLGVLQLLFLLGAILLFRRCMHWMSLPATRGEWSAMMREAGHKASAEWAEEAAAHSPDDDGPRNEDR